MNKQNNWDHTTGASTVKGFVEKNTHEEMAKAIKATKPGKATGPPGIYAESISTRGEVRIDAMMKLCQCVLDGKEMPNE